MLKPLFIILLSLVAGSFLNMLIYRLPRGLKMGCARSICPRCAQMLPVRSLVPVISYALQLGRCACCQARIPFRYLAVELGMVGLSIWGFLKSPSLIEFGGYFLFLVIITAVFWIDFETFLIPDELVVGLAILGVAKSAYLNTLPDAWLGMIVGFGSLWLIANLATWYYKKPAMGFGDVKLAGAMGLYLGWHHTLIALDLAFIIGGLLGVVLILTKYRKLSDLVPFGPALCVAAWVAALYGSVIWKWVVG